MNFYLKALGAFFFLKHLAQSLLPSITLCRVSLALSLETSPRISLRACSYANSFNTKNLISFWCPLWLLHLLEVLVCQKENGTLLKSLCCLFVWLHVNHVFKIQVSGSNLNRMVFRTQVYGFLKLCKTRTTGKNTHLDQKYPEGLIGFKPTTQVIVPILSIQISIQMASSYVNQVRSAFLYFTFFLLA